MITPWDVIMLVYAAGVAYHAPRILKRWLLITTCDPLQLCEGCRDERKRVMHEADEWEVIGVFGSALMVVVEAAIWYLKPCLPAIRKAAGKEPLRACSKAPCLAYAGGKGTA